MQGAYGISRIFSRLRRIHGALPLSIVWIREWIEGTCKGKPLSSILEWSLDHTWPIDIPIKAFRRLQTAEMFTLADPQHTA